MAALDDAVSTLKTAVANLSAIQQALLQIFPRITGTVTLTAGATTVVTQPATAANSVVLWSPTNASAALLLRANGLYLSGSTAGSNFTLSVQSGVAAGSEQLSYVMINPS